MPLDADWSVELGREDNTLEFPWSDPEGAVQFYDLKRQPELLDRLEEVQVFPELRDVLALLNNPNSPLQTAKCDVWLEQIDEPLEAGEAVPHGYGSYVDLVFGDDRRYSFKAHESFVKASAGRGVDGPKNSSVEFIVRRCYFHGVDTGPAADDQVRQGFYATMYVYGRGPDETTARSNWGVALETAAADALSAAVNLS